jgi:hypothetical protein
MPISLIYDYKKLQYDLNQFCSWYANNGLNLNMDKCSQITFSRNEQDFMFSYHINNKNFKIVSNIKDLSIIFSNDLAFTKHINEIHNKALRVFGFLKRDCWEFHNPIFLRFFSL